jgi:hypothetical protein
MRFIPTRIHGMLDYLMGILLILSPWIFGFADAANEAAIWVPVVLGIAAILYSLFTDYEMGLVRSIPMPTHLILDIASGALLALSPWLFGFADEVFWPHLLVGLLEIGAGLTTHTTPGIAGHGASGTGRFAVR